MRAICVALGITLGVLVPHPGEALSTRPGRQAGRGQTPVQVTRRWPVKISRSQLRQALELVGRRRSPGTPVSANHTAVIPAVWQRLVDCEAGGDWQASTGNGFYDGPQFTLSTWYAYGGRVFPTQASRAWQLVIGRRILTTGWNGIPPQGQGAWPVCGPEAGLVPGS